MNQGDSKRGRSSAARRMLSGVLAIGLIMTLGPLSASATWDSALGEAMIISVDNDGNQDSRGSRDPSMSDDGRYVAFLTGGALVPEDDNGYRDIYVYDTVSMETTRVSVATDGTQGDDDCGNDGLRGPAISGDGRYVAFDSNATNLVPDDFEIGTGGRDIFVRDMVSDETTLVTHSGFGDNTGGSRDPAISHDGRYVVLMTSRDLVDEDNNGYRDIYMVDMSSGETTIVSSDVTGDNSNGDSWAPDISDDGRYVVFSSDADDLVANDTNLHEDIFMRDMDTGVTTRVSVTATGGQANDDSWDPKISGDGSFIVFDSDAALAGADRNGTNRRDVYGYDVATGKTMLISNPRTGGDEWNRGSRDPAISSDGNIIVFISGLDLVDRDNNWAPDIYTYDRATGSYTLHDVTWADGRVDDDDEDFELNAAGDWLAFSSWDNEIIQYDQNGSTADVFMTQLWMSLDDGGTRLGGTDRYATAAMISKNAYPNGADTVIIATGENWPDALGASALSGAIDGPILITRTDTLPASIKAEITRLGATDAYVVGGTAAVSAAVMSEVDAMLSGTVRRLSGADRYVTANIMASEVIRLMGDDYDGTCLIATGENYPDAVGGAPLAAGFGWPVLLVRPGADTVPTPYEVEEAVVLGGSLAISTVIESDLRFEFGSDSVVRLAGANRYETSGEVAEYGVMNGLRWDGVGISTGSSFPDALTGGALLGRQASVMLLTPSTSLAAPAASILSANKSGIDTVYFIGGTLAVSDSVKASVESALGW